jgi:hypothetical protein
MEAANVWMLLTAPGSTGMAASLAANIGEGTHGNAIRRVDVKEGNAELRHSADVGTRLAYGVLYREKYLNRQLIVGYESSIKLLNVHGRSADLAFALAFAVAEIGARHDGNKNEGAFPRLAATGELSEDGRILSVDGVTEKLALALAILPPNSMLIFPGANERDVTEDQRQQAKARGIALLPTFRLEEALRHIGFVISRTWLDNPFRGLEPFEFKHASIFFGREKEIDDILSLHLRRVEKGQPSLLVRGPSGSGKSSLVLAGVIPALLRRASSRSAAGNIRWGLLRPRATTADIDPERELEALAQTLRSSWYHGEAGALFPREDDTAPAPALDPAFFLNWLRMHVTSSDQTQFVWVLDQMEEWLEGPLQPATVTRLFAFLTELANHGVWLIATLTNSAYPFFCQHSELAAIFGIEGQYVLNPQHCPAAIEAVIREPMQAAGLQFEPGLETELFAAASHGGADVLPLLELLLTELYERRDPSRNELRFEDYRSAGGLDGVVSARAEAIFHHCSDAERGMVPQLLWKLATRAEILPSDYAEESHMRALISAFQAKRLLVEDRDVRGNSSVRAAHEALFRHWSRAVEQRERDEHDVSLWLDLIRESGQWARGERALIPSGPQLEAAQSLYKRRAADWTASDAPVVDYVRASLFQRTRRCTVAAIALGVPAVAAAGFGINGLRSYLEGLHLTRITFQDVSVPAPDFRIAASPYLRRFGVSISARSPENSSVVIRSNIGLYGGDAADPTSSSEHLLTQENDPLVAPIGFTLSFDRPFKVVKLLRAALWAATKKGGVTHPAWHAYALDDAGLEVASGGETLLASYETVPAKWHVLQPADGKTIARLRIESDCRNAAGVPFAGFQAMLIQEIQLVH